MRHGKGKISRRGYFSLITYSFYQYSWLFSRPSLISQVKIARRWELWRCGGASSDDPHNLVVRGTHSQVRTATAVVRPSSSSHAKQQISAKVAIILIPLLTCTDTSVEYSLERR